MAPYYKRSWVGLRLAYSHDCEIAWKRGKQGSERTFPRNGSFFEFRYGRHLWSEEEYYEGRALR